jgi:hypothetical protein
MTKRKDPADLMDQARHGHARKHKYTKTYTAWASMITRCTNPNYKDKVNGNYEPENCRWATYREQILNRRNALYITLCGEQIAVVDACIKYGLNYRAFRIRRSRYKLTPIEAFLAQIELHGKEFVSYPKP